MHENLTEEDAYSLHFPTITGNWRLSLFFNHNCLPVQGWKIHVSATSRNYLSILSSLGALINEEQWSAKVIASGALLKSMNVGMRYGYSQIGKFITIYCESEKDFLNKIEILTKITQKFNGPSVPSDLRVPGSRCLFYRYGSFVNNGNTIIDPGNNIVPDRRERKYAVPDWLTDPLQAPKECPVSLLDRGYLVYKCLSQRGKGGVYCALSLHEAVARDVIIKEGRSYGEEDSLGRDGAARVKHEIYALKLARLAGVNAPRVITQIETPKRILIILDRIPGVSLDKLLNLLSYKRKKLALHQGLRIAEKLADQLEKLHQNELCHRDIKPANFLIDIRGSVGLIDFEGAVSGRVKLDDPWGSYGYAPPEWLEVTEYTQRLSADIYALGSTLWQIFTGVMLTPNENAKRQLMSQCRLPADLQRALMRMTSSDPGIRPGIAVVSQIIKKLKPAHEPSKFLVQIISKIDRQ